MQEFHMVCETEDRAAHYSQNGVPLGDSCFFLYLAPEEPVPSPCGLRELEKPFIKAASRMTVYNLCTFLKRMFKCSPESQVQILFRGELLDNELALSQVLRRFKEKRSQGGFLRLYYRSKSEGNRNSDDAAHDDEMKDV
jgi:hypothetical protein